MYGVLSRLIYGNEIVGIRVLVYQSYETGKNEVLDIDMDVVRELKIPYENETLDEVNLELKNGVLVDSMEYKGETAKCIEDLYTSKRNLYKDLYMNENGYISDIEKFSDTKEIDTAVVKRTINSYRCISLNNEMKELRKQISAIDEYIGEDESDSIDMECMRSIRLQCSEELELLKSRKNKMLS